MYVAGNGMGWMGHYVFLVGYDDGQGSFLSQDSYYGPNTRWPYEDLLYNWRAFNFTYLVVYPPNRESDALGAVGPNAGEAYNLAQSLALAQSETTALQGDALAYAYFNLGTNYTAGGSYTAAVLAYDRARALGLPYRFLWYQTGPYEAYYFAGRYQEVVDLASQTLDIQGNLEESWYWRGMARMALGDRADAIADWREALVRHPGYEPASTQLQLAGVAE
jgi:tetratricopeptide (TPR) repeat protein